LFFYTPAISEASVEGIEQGASRSCCRERRQHAATFGRLSKYDIAAWRRNFLAALAG
jgi:hypothetical protein